VSCVHQQRHPAFASHAQLAQLHMMSTEKPHRCCRQQLL
jgi:hypothetical protein